MEWRRAQLKQEQWFRGVVVGGDGPAERDATLDAKSGVIRAIVQEGTEYPTSQNRDVGHPCLCWMEIAKGNRRSSLIALRAISYRMTVLSEGGLRYPTSQNRDVGHRQLGILKAHNLLIPKWRKWQR